MVLARPTRLCNFLEWRDLKIVYRRYASLYFVMAVDPDDNELVVLETVHHFVEILDRYFGNVCELDLIFNFHKAYYILDELLCSGSCDDEARLARGGARESHARGRERARRRRTARVK